MGPKLLWHSVPIDLEAPRVHLGTWAAGNKGNKVTSFVFQG